MHPAYCVDCEKSCEWEHDPDHVVIGKKLQELRDLDAEESLKGQEDHQEAAEGSEHS